MLAVGAGGGSLDIFCLVYYFSLLLPLSGRRPDIDLLSQRAVKPNTTNQPILFFFLNVISAFEGSLKDLFLLLCI